ncbi:penicillin-binding protein activator [Pseudidiomarina taiwanensis]|uniref:Penicillin-binding protein activator n=1 Tax=Pseudidiomarina taiwanensis TaxID=337250 RepID=A0A432ZLY4_9GAMM|nr:penicillin-binding protein activator [Pseudidiomarina taiwanensis]RUO78542.1 hypothetical protein CWI83_05835 [Pseudidiomarina taiwanensis]
MAYSLQSLVTCLLQHTLLQRLSPSSHRLTRQHTRQAVRHSVPNFGAKYLFVRLLAMAFCMSLLNGCAQTSANRDGAANKSMSPEVERQVTTPTEQTQRNAASWLALAEQQSGTAQVSALLNAAQQLQFDGAWQQAAAVLAQLDRYFPTTQLDQQQSFKRGLLHAAFAVEQKNWQAAQAQLDELAPIYPRVANQTSLSLTYRQLQQVLAVAQEDWPLALQLQLEFIAQEQPLRFDTWTLLTADTVSPSLRSDDLVGTGWLALRRILDDVVSAKLTAAQGLAQWQKNYPEHPATEIAADVLAAPAPVQRVLALLPLTGAFAAQGQAVRDGMVLALAKRPDIDVEFVDTATFDFNALPERLQQTQADTLVGPLLKAHIDKVPMALLPEQVNWVMLNTPNNGLGATHAGATVSYALDSETEIRQAAQLFAQRGYRSVLVLAPNTARGQQLEQVFEQSLMAATDGAGRVFFGRYQDADEMKTAVQDQLAVSASDARIWQIKIAAGKIIVEAEARSRDDIEAIYLVGGIEQTRLLKPFIDVTISPFRQPIPVYANSTSHILRSELSENDLDQVHFSDAPWLLPNHPQSKALQQLLQLRPQWDYDLTRLAAFGHDSIYIALQQYWLDRTPGLRLNGLTGALQIRNGRIQRTLSWARYAGQRVVPLR